MKLDAVRRGVRPAADRVLLVGTEGVGKSTFAADAPSPIFLAAEDGIRHLDVASFPEPTSFADVMDAIRTLQTEPHEFQTLVIDTIDWVEPLVFEAVCQQNGWTTIEDPGYGRASPWRSSSGARAPRGP
ncbi:MAG: ATP-binding protein [Planctomycetota bacterium]